MREGGTKRDVCEHLQFERVGGLEHFRFVLLEFYIYSESELGSALPLSLPWFLSPLALAVYVVKSRALSLFGLPCYLVKLGTRTVGLLAIQEQRESLVVASLGVAKGYRRLGIGTCMLRHIEATARHKGRRSLEVDVYRKNVPAQGLYSRYGFSFTHNVRMSNLMRGRKRVSACAADSVVINPLESAAAQAS